MTLELSRASLKGGLVQGVGMRVIGVPAVGGWGVDGGYKKMDFLLQFSVISKVLEISGFSKRLKINEQLMIEKYFWSQP